MRHSPANHPTRRPRKRGPRGFSLPVVLGLSALLAVAVSTMMAAVVSAGKTGGDMLRRRKAFYACDGLSRVVTKMSQSYMATTVDPDSAGLNSYIESSAGGPSLSTIAPPNFSVTNFQVDTIGDSQSSTPIPSGPFRGMNARQDTIEMKIEARHNVMNYVCRSQQTVTLGKVALFQFYVFSDTYFDGHPGPQMTLTGRAHINGDACPGGNMDIERITASGALRQLGNGNCRFSGGSSDTRIQKPDGTFSLLSPANDHDSPGWEQDALTEWGGNALDEDHDVPNLKPPTIGIPRAQLGAHAQDAATEMAGTQTSTVANTGSLRFLIDPVAATDPADVREQKMAELADIRIIDGVWYKDVGAWPGEAIWSDHPGDFTLTNASTGSGLAMAGNQVGQATVAGAQAWGATPRRYSYYGTTAGGALLPLAGAPPAVISYGSVRRSPATTFPVVYPGVSAARPIWVPGGWIGPEMCNRDYAGGTVVEASSATTWGTAARFVDARAGSMCSDGATPISPEQVLINATREGFRENHRGGPYGGILADTGFRSQVVPANFDVMAFQAAMQDATPGELGSHFGGGVDFNGIVWMTFTWPGSLNGMNGSAMADVKPMDDQGTASGFVPNTGNNDVRMLTDISNATSPAARVAAFSQPVAPTRVTGAVGGAVDVNNGAASNRELPYPLCSANGTEGVVYTGAAAVVGTVATGDFIVPRCSDYTGSRGGRITAVRIVNGRDLDPVVFPKGLTLSTNLPVFVVGDMNIVSAPNDGAVLPQAAGSETWVPMLITGDVMYHASNSWDDQLSPFSIRSLASQRQAVDTTFNISELIGWVPSENGIGGTRFHNLQGFQERWGSAVNHNINGSVAIGWHAVYFRNNRSSGGQFAYSPPTRNWAFDSNYSLFSNQPPGTPTFDVAATKKFKRDSLN